jgi:hypothetical protein
MEEKIEDMERQALAATELAGELEGDLLQHQFEALEFHGTADNQLLELKRKMGVLGPGESEDRPQLTDGEGDDVSEAELVEDDDLSKEG